jgi:hypothetical protein
MLKHTAHCEIKHWNVDIVCSYIRMREGYWPVWAVEQVPRGYCNSVDGDDLLCPSNSDLTYLTDPLFWWKSNGTEFFVHGTKQHDVNPYRGRIRLEVRVQAPEGMRKPWCGWWQGVRPSASPKLLNWFRQDFFISSVGLLFRFISAGCNLKLISKLRFQVPPSASMKMAVFWDVVPCSLNNRSVSVIPHGATYQKTVIFFDNSSVSAVCA